MTLFYNAKTKLKYRNNRVLIKTYGSYGVSQEFGFKYSELLAVENEHWIIANAHIRGGGEMGEEWHQAGMKNNKSNSISDFISCAQYLISEKISKPKLMAA